MKTRNTHFHTATILLAILASGTIPFFAIAQTTQVQKSHSAFCQEVGSLSSTLSDTDISTLLSPLTPATSRIAAESIEISDNRARIDTERASAVARLTDKARGHANKSAVSSFAKAIGEAAVLRRNAVDAALQAYSAGIDQLSKTPLQTALPSAVELSGLAARMKQAADMCQSSTSETSVRTLYSADIQKTIKDMSAIHTYLETTDAKVTLLSQTRSGAVTQADAAYAATATQAMNILNATFHQ